MRLCPYRAEERMPQRLLQGDAAADVVLQHAADQVEELPLLLSHPGHDLLKENHHRSGFYTWLLKLADTQRCCCVPSGVYSVSSRSCQTSFVHPSADGHYGCNVFFCTQHGSEATFTTEATFLKFRCNTKLLQIYGWNFSRIFWLFF